jgi:hypothetical protein
MDGRLFGGADHGSQNVGLERRAWPLAQAVSGSVGSQGTATNAPALRVGTGSVLAIARAFSRWRSGLRSFYGRRGTLLAFDAASSITNPVIAVRLARSMPGLP